MARHDMAEAHSRGVKWEREAPLTERSAVAGQACKAPEIKIRY